jgi:tetratricopeptide (TPR) repeat protein
MEIMDGTEGNGGILQYLPECEFGLTVFTTRDSQIAQSLAGSDIVELAKMTHPDAVDILKNTLVRKDLLHDEATTARLLSELDYLPLAMTQATAYVNCNKVSLSGYLDLLQGTEQDMVHILSTEMRDNTRYTQVSSAVAKTWLVSFKQLVQRNGDAAEVLRYMSCIEWKSIPHSILPSVQPAARMANAIGTLCSYSFIAPRDGEEIYDMHRLVHLAARVWVREEGVMVETQKTALEHLCGIFPSEDYENRGVWREYIPHASRMRNAKDGDHSGARGKLCLKVGCCLRVDGRIRDAVGWLEESRDLRADLLDDDADKLSTQHELAIAYQANGQVKDAVRLLEHIVAISERELVEDHPDRLASQHELARAYQANGQVKDAVRLLEHVVAIQERVLAEDYPDRLASQHELARAYKANGQVKDAVRLLEHVVVIQERVLAEDHLNRLASQHELAIAYQANGQVKDAVRLLEHVVVIQERVLAEDHPNRLASQHGLARAYHANGQVKDAVQLLQHVVAIWERVLVEDHPDRLHSQHNLAMAYQANGQVKDAVQLLEHVVAIQKRVLAEDHPDQLASQHELARVYQANRQVKEAIRLLEHVVAIEERVLAEDHPSRLASQHELARAYQANRQEDHPHRLASKAMLARAHRAYRELERFESEPFSQVNDRGAGSPSIPRSIAELEKPLLRQSQRTKPPAYGIPSQAKGNEEGEREKLGNFSRKRKRK